ncbi:two-component system response regulator YesN [Paenibacillus cellulosilyticus]|uniref:Two-component system response regulator YesN n=1 Tax=Paenibacillus cellulosilyticus TaxID=375489 RepID=A0A2V2YNM5_9BACL|nr:response regulator [Paenibacillus cellulosilyticus]PWV90998.1 two-component system response regulator YesN [Paenibacillus cellulosilyticus]QKS45211.1 response regulator [Paenibacillus cellulosilyticus]
MKQLLIVDDEPLAIRGIVNAVNWESIGITNVLTAVNAGQAKQLFGDHDIDIMLCDIEMPQESGIDLLAWVREHSPETASIFLTCHADFSFAQKAIQLGSLDYLLKPIPPQELEAVIRKAVNHITAEHAIKLHSESWVKHHPLFIERFWLDIVNRAIPSNPISIQAAARERNIELPIDMKVMPILIHVRRWHKSLSLRDEKILEYALMNTLQEMVQGVGRSAGVVPVERGRLLAILTELTMDAPATLNLMKTYIDSCQKFFYCDISCYMSEEIVSLHELPEQKRRLEELQRDHVTSDNEVLLLQRKTAAVSSSIARPNMKRWRIHFEEGNRLKLLQEVNEHLNALRSTPGVSSEALHQFVQDTLQIAYSVLYDKGIQAHQLFQDRSSLELLERATISLTDLRLWMEHLIDKALGYAADLEASGTIVDKVKAFISKNMKEDLNRESIAASFFLHPDYLNRIFKKEMSLSMTEFLHQERMNAAMELLTETEQPITVIASNIGYANLSHFARNFRKHTGYNPNEYRQKSVRESQT